MPCSVPEGRAPKLQQENRLKTDWYTEFQLPTTAILKVFSVSTLQGTDHSCDLTPSK